MAENKDASEAKLATTHLIRYADELRQFLASEEQRVLLLHGRWGTGKTYFWTHFVGAKDVKLTEDSYSYVSLFGASSVSHIKSLILFGGSPLRTGEDLSLGRRLANFVARSRRYLPEASLPHLGNIGNAMGAFDELLIKNYLVCFDDLERRNKQLDLEQFFGLVALLKEQNECKIVIICNETELSENDRQSLNKYREKIVDRQLTYEPPFEENFRIVFPDGNPSIREVLAAVRLNNIRVFQQVKWCLNYFKPHLQECQLGFVEKFNQQCARFACVHFALSKEITFEQLRSTTWLGVSLSDRKNGLSDAAKDIVRNLQFLPTDADDLIVDYLRNGYCDIARLQSVLSHLNQEYQKREADELLTGIWATVWHSYKANADEIARAAEEYVTKYSDCIPYKYAADLLDFVKKIDGSFDAEAKKAALAKSVIPTADVGTLRQIQTACGPSEVTEEARTRERELKSRRSIEDLVVALGGSEGWNPADFAELNEYSENDLFEWLSAAQRPYLLATIAEVVTRGQLESGENRGGKEIGVKFRNVFERFAKRSALDNERSIHAFALIRRQMKQFGREVTADICPPENTGDKPA
jgi:hypothetical protein